LPSYSVLKEEFSNDFEIAVIGQTVDDLTASRIAVSLYRTQTNVRVLRLTAQYSRPGFSFDGAFFIEDGPGAFLSCVAELIAKERQRSPRFALCVCNPVAGLCTQEVKSADLRLLALFGEYSVSAT
jgi:hypothetical protein